MTTLAVDVGGSHVKIMRSGSDEERKVESGPDMTPDLLVAAVHGLAEGWAYDHVSIGFPAVVKDNVITTDPVHLGSGWAGYDFTTAFKCPVRVINDAAMQALGSWQGGKMLFLGLGTGLGTALIVDGIVEPMEIGHLPYLKHTYEDYVSDRALERMGKKKWRKHVADVVKRLIGALEPDDVVIGGGNVRHLKKLPPRCRAGDNANAFSGGFKLWETAKRRTRRPRSAGARKQKGGHA